jgi:hypothetical protein
MNKGDITMQIDHLLVDEILIDNANLSGIVKSTLYDFRQPQWVSVHRERIGHPLGPVTMISDDPKDNLMGISARSFGERTLVTEGPPARLEISYTDRWTIPDLSLYTLVLPKKYVLTQMTFDSHLNSTLEIGVNPSQQLFYYALFADWQSKMHEFFIASRVQENIKQYQEIIGSVGAVHGTKQFQEFSHAVGRQVSSADFWFKLLEFGSKFIPKT